MNRDFTCQGAKNESLDTDKITDVKQFLKDFIVQVFVVVRADVVTGNVYLNSAFAVLKFYKAGFTHHATAHHSSCDDYLAFFFLFLETVFNVGRESIGGILGSWIGVNAHRAQFLQALATANLLLTKF